MGRSPLVVLPPLFYAGSCYVTASSGPSSGFLQELIRSRITVLLKGEILAQVEQRGASLWNNSRVTILIISRFCPEESDLSSHTARNADTCFMWKQDSRSKTRRRELVFSYKLFLLLENCPDVENYLERYHAFFSSLPSKPVLWKADRTSPHCAFDKLS